MKNLFSIIIFIAVLFSFLSVGCEKTDLQKSTILDDQEITERYVAQCGNCPNMDDCCGRILFVSGTSITFETCGTTDGGAGACSDDLGTCELIDGFKNSTTTMNTVNDYRLICMEENHGFYIKVTSVTGTVVLNISFAT